MLTTDPAIQYLRMSWEDYLELPSKPKAEWVDGEVVVMAPNNPVHAAAAGKVIVRLDGALPGLYVLSEVGVHLPRNRLRAPDISVARAVPGDGWLTEPPVLVVEVLSSSTRREDTLRKGPEYLAGGIGQFWIVDPDAGAIDVFENVDGEWRPLLRLDRDRPTGEVAVGEHGTVALDVREILPTLDG